MARAAIYAIRPVVSNVLCTAYCTVLNASALASECYGIMLALGHAFERAEPQQVG